MISLTNNSQFHVNRDILNRICSLAIQFVPKFLTLWVKRLSCTEKLLDRFIMELRIFKQSPQDQRDPRLAGLET